MESSEKAPPTQTPGERLREARELAGISPREMADRLNWLPAHIAAVEENRFEGLRGTAFVRGYLRAYARALGLDEDEMVSLYAAMQPEASAAAQQQPRSPAPAAPGQNAGLWIVVCCLFAVGTIAGIWWYQNAESSDARPPVQQSSETSAEAAIAEAAETAEAAEPAEPAETTGSEETGIEAEPATPEVNREDSTAEELPELTAGPADTGAEAAGSGVTEAIGPADALLEFSFSGDCWIEVRDGNGELIYADLRGPGDTLRLDGKPPFEILAGDAAAVSLRYRGEPYPVTTRPGRDTARFTVGEP